MAGLAQETHEPSRIHFLGTHDVQARADGCDLAVLDGDVPDERGLTVAYDHLPVADDNVRHAAAETLNLLRVNTHWQGITPAGPGQNRSAQILHAAEWRCTSICCGDDGWREVHFV